jgi:hypothetical protein
VIENNGIELVVMPRRNGAVLLGASCDSPARRRRAFGFASTQQSLAQACAMPSFEA